MNFNKGLIAVAALMVSGSSMAAELFIGGTVGNQWSQSEAVLKSNVGGLHSSSDTFTSSNANWGLRAGAITGNHRFTGTYTRSAGIEENTIDARNHNILASYDYLVPFADNGRLVWFGGASVGAGAVKSGVAGNDIKPVYGVQTGLQYNFDSKISVELAYRYLRQDYTKTSEEFSAAEPQSNPSEGHANLQYSLNNTHQLYLGIDYRF